MTNIISAFSLPTKTAPIIASAMVLLPVLSPAPVSIPEYNPGIIVVSQISSDFSQDLLYNPIQTYGEVCSVDENVNLETNLQKINRFRRLNQTGWNGYNAEPISTSVIRYAGRLVIALGKRQPEVFPVPNGSIQLEYENKDGSYLEFEVPQRGEIEVFQIDGEGREKEYTIPRNVHFLVETVEKFYGKSI